MPQGKPLVIAKPKKSTRSPRRTRSTVSAIVRAVPRDAEAELAKRLARFLLTLTEPAPNKPPNSLD